MRIAFKRVALIPLLLPIFLAGCEAADDEEEAAALPVRTQAVQAGTLFRRLGYTGDIEGQTEIRVFSPIPERIISLSAREGDRVRQGDVLAVVRSKSLAQGVKQAAGGLDAMRAQRDSLQDQADRMRKLADSGAVTASQLLAVEGQLAAAQAQVRQLEAALGQANQMKGDAIVRAPIDGVIGQVFVEVGDMAVPQVPVCTLVDMDRIKIKVRVPESDLPSIATGQPATFRLIAENDVVRSASISRVSPVLDRLSRTATLEIDFDNADHLLRPGMLARVEIEVERRADVVWVPNSALTVTAERRGEDQIYRAVVVEGGKAVERKVVLGLADGTRVQILDGLKLGDQVVVEGQHLLADGDPVEVVPDAAPAADPAGTSGGS